MSETAGQKVTGVVLVPGGRGVGLFRWDLPQRLTEPTEPANDAANTQCPECAECGARPGQAHDPLCKTAERNDDRAHSGRDGSAEVGGNPMNRECDDKYGLILVWVKETMRQKNHDWPGKPLGQIPLMCQPQLNAAIRDGLVRIVERPSKVNPTRVAHFVALTTESADVR